MGLPCRICSASRKGAHSKAFNAALAAESTFRWTGCCVPSMLWSTTSHKWPSFQNSLSWSIKPFWWQGNSLWRSFIADKIEASDFGRLACRWKSEFKVWAEVMRWWDEHCRAVQVAMHMNVQDIKDSNRTWRWMNMKWAQDTHHDISNAAQVSRSSAKKAAVSSASSRPSKCGLKPTVASDRLPWSKGLGIPGLPHSSAPSRSSSTSFRSEASWSKMTK